MPVSRLTVQLRRLVFRSSPTPTAAAPAAADFTTVAHPGPPYTRSALRDGCAPASSAACPVLEPWKNNAKA